MKTVRSERDGAIVRIWLARPKVRNAFNGEVVEQLGEAFTCLAADVRIVVLSGEGKAFCAGVDLGWMQRSVRFSEGENVRDAKALATLFNTIDTCPQAVIGRVNGAALGGGLGLIACCDMVVAADTARFGFTEARLGLVPAVISPYVIRKTGSGPLRRYFLTGELFGAHTAMGLGLVHKVVEPERLDQAVTDLTETVLKSGPSAVSEAKALIRAVDNQRPEDVLDYTARTIALTRVSPEGQEGMAAFLQKRRPNWQP